MGQAKRNGQGYPSSAQHRPLDQVVSLLIPAIWRHFDFAANEDRNYNSTAEIALPRCPEGRSQLQVVRARFLSESIVRYGADQPPGIDHWLLRIVTADMLTQWRLRICLEFPVLRDYNAYPRRAATHLQLHGEALPLDGFSAVPLPACHCQAAEGI